MALELYNYQKDGLEYCYSRLAKSLGSLLTMDMGTGKTYTAIAVMDRLIRDGATRVLIVCPKSVSSNWVSEIRKFYSEFSPVSNIPNIMDMTMVAGTKRLVSFPEEPTVCIINYESIWSRATRKVSLAPWVEIFDPELVIADEVHLLGSPDSKLSKAMHLLSDTAKYRIGLTGTPMRNSPLNLWSVFRFVEKSVFTMPFTVFRSRYAVMIDMGGSHYNQSEGTWKDFTYKKVTNFKNIDELSAKVTANSYRVILNEVVDMPPCREVIIPVHMDEKDTKMYEDLVSMSAGFIENKDLQGLKSSFMKVRRFLGGFVNQMDDNSTEEWFFGNVAKVNAFVQLCYHLKEEKKQFVVFCQFTAEIEFLTQYAQECGLVAKMMYGQTKQNDRQLIVNDFQSGDVDVLICQTSVAGTGLNLTAGTVSVFYSLSYSFTDREQALRRIYRIGQKKSVTHITLLTVGTLDEKIYTAVINKKSISESITGLRELIS